MHRRSFISYAALQRALLGAVALTLASSVWAANRPKGWVTICKEGASCSVAANTNVAFGRADQFLYKVLSGSFVCNEATFGGRIAGGVDECSTATSTSSSSSASSVASSSAPSSTSSSSKSSSVASSISSSALSSTSSASSSASSSKSSSSSSAASSTAGASLDLTKYKLAGSYSLPSKAAEASGITWNWDTDTLFVIGDEGKAIVQVSKTGAQIDTMTLSGFADTEGITYIGNGKFVVTEERLQDAYLLTYSAGGTATRSSLPSVSIGATVDNIGIEGISYDRVTENYVAVKEKDSQAVHGLKIDFSLKTISVSQLFDPALLKLADLSDVQTLSGVTALGATAKNNLLIVSQESSMLLEVTRSGAIVSKFDLSSISTDIEGLTIDKNGVIYLTAQSPKLYVLTLK
jgi:uncharacterized protein YjiK